MERENGDAGYQSFVKVTEQGSDDFMELPREKDGTVLLSTVQAQYPSAIGLKYKSASGGWRGIRAEDNVLDPPFGGWGENLYFITQSGEFTCRIFIHKYRDTFASPLNHFLDILL